MIVAKLMCLGAWSIATALTIVGAKLGLPLVLIVRAFTGIGKVLKFNLTESGLFYVFPWLIMAFSANMGGWIADTLVSNGLPVTTVHKGTHALCQSGLYSNQQDIGPWYSVVRDATKECKSANKVRDLLMEITTHHERLHQHLANKDKVYMLVKCEPPTMVTANAAWVLSLKIRPDIA